MVIIRTSAIEVSIQAVSPELYVHFSSTAGVLPSAEAAAQAGGAGGAAGGRACGRGVVFLARAHANGGFERVAENLAVADLAGAGGGDDRVDHLVDEVRGY